MLVSFLVVGLLQAVLQVAHARLDGECKKDLCWCLGQRLGLSVLESPLRAR